MINRARYLRISGVQVQAGCDHPALVERSFIGGKMIGHCASRVWDLMGSILQKT